jgi:uncharacterized repeat protein (TIGR04076 family)
MCVTDMLKKFRQHNFTPLKTLACLVSFILLVDAAHIRLNEMAERSRVKITVLKRFKPSEVFEKSPVTPVTPPAVCEIFADGQEFLVGEDGEMPKGFCAPAWQTILSNVRTLAFGGNFPWFKERGVSVNCCYDGLRPVVFKLERV